MQKSIFTDNYIKRNSLKAWVLAARPKTLTGAAVPVMLGVALAWSSLTMTLSDILPVILCFLFAFIMQIDANFVNDYFDCVKKKDNEKRLGPERACQQGWVTLRAMKWAIGITSVMACVVGLPLVCYGGMEMIGIGALCVIFCFLYTTLFAGIGLGDLLVLVFFGIIPVTCTWWVCTPHDQSVSFVDVIQTTAFVTPFLVSIACGLVVDTLLIVNNYRDIDNDREVGKRTLVVLIGRNATEWLYISLPALAIVVILCLFGWTNVNIILAFGVYILYTTTWNKMRMIAKGKELNKVLGMTARNIFAFGLLVSLIIILS